MRMNKLRTILCVMVVIFFSSISFAEPLNASVYADGFTGHRMANGNPYNPRLYTVAHRYLPFGTVVELFNPVNNKRCYATVTDRGPWYGRRDLDLSKAVARELGVQGLAHITYKVIRTK